MGHIDVIRKQAEGPVIIVNMIVIGKSSVGKSVLVKRFVTEFNGVIYDPRTDIICPTVTPSLTKITVLINKKMVELRFWDTAGQERFNSLSKNYYRNADGALLVYDITDKDSFDSLADYIKMVDENCPKDVVVSLLANKNDMVGQRVLCPSLGVTLSNSKNYKFFETSSYTNLNVANAIIFTVKTILEQPNKNLTMKKENGRKFNRDSNENNGDTCAC